MAAAPPTIRVATWNIRAAIGPGEPFPPAWWRHVRGERLERIATRIRGLDPDVVGLQEVAVFTVDGIVHDQPAALASMTGLEMRYTAAHAFPLVEPATGRIVGAAMWGNALLSRLPFESSTGFGLPVGGDDDLVEPADSGRPLAGVTFLEAPWGTREPRSVVGGRVRVGSASITVMSTHLTYAGTAQRRSQAAALADVVRTTDGPVVLLGDYNSPIDADALAPLVEVLVDTFDAAGVPHDDERRHTCGPLAIDHVLTRGLRTISCEVDRAAGDASDHLPVVAELALPDPG